MKTLLIATLLYSFPSFAEETLRDVQDRQAEERHFARKGWDASKKQCQESHPNWYKSEHPDYDKNFECQKKVKTMMHAFEDKHNAEICEKFNISCREAKRSVGSID